LNFVAIATLDDPDSLAVEWRSLQVISRFESDLPKPANGQIVNKPQFLSGFALFDERFPGGHGDAAVGELGR